MSKSRAKKPAGWYSAAARAERAAAAVAERERTDAAVQRAITEADRLAAKVEDRARETAPVRAAADRNYRQQARALRKELRPKRVDGEGPTPHTRRQRRDSGLQAMLAAGLLTPEMLTAAQEIEQVFHAVTIGLRSRAGSLEPSSPGERMPMAEKTAWAYAKRYKPWADELSADRKRGGAPALAITVAVIIDDMTLTQAEQDFRMRRRTVQFWVRRSLARYAELLDGRPGIGLVAEVERAWGCSARRAA